MLPVVATPAVVARKIVIYSWGMVVTTLALIPYAGWIYGACALVLGVGSCSRRIASAAGSPPASPPPRCGCSTCRSGT